MAALLSAIVWMPYRMLNDIYDCYLFITDDDEEDDDEG